MNPFKSEKKFTLTNSKNLRHNQDPNQKYFSQMKSQNSYTNKFNGSQKNLPDNLKKQSYVPQVQQYQQFEAVVNKMNGPTFSLKKYMDIQSNINTEVKSFQDIKLLDYDTDKHNNEISKHHNFINPIQFKQNQKYQFENIDFFEDSEENQCQQKEQQKIKSN